MPDCTVLGMPLYTEEGDSILTAQPLAAFTVVKVMHADGQLDYLTAATEGLQTVECLGMAEYAALRLRHGLTTRLEDGD